jgi:hypothetical protein
MAEKQAILNGFRQSTSPTRKQFSVVPPNRSTSPNSGYRDLSPRNWTTNLSVDNG